MNADLDRDRWPRLKLATHPELDWVETEYTQAQLLEIADAVGQPSTPAIYVKGRHDAVWNNAIEDVLRVLAASPRALEKLNYRKPTPPARVIGLNRAVHARVLTELLPNAKAAEVWQDVAKVWDVRPGTVKDDVTDHRARAAAPPVFLPESSTYLPEDSVRWVEYRPDDAERLVQAIVTNTCNTRRRAGDPRSSRDDVLEDFDKDMRDRAQQLGSA